MPDGGLDFIDSPDSMAAEGMSTSIGTLSGTEGPDSFFSYGTPAVQYQGSATEVQDLWIYS